MSSKLFATATTTPLLETTSQYTAPLAQLVPYVKATSLFLLRAANSAFQFSKHLVVPIPILAYIFAPVTVFLGYLFYIFVFAPYSTLLYLLEALHPLYVFCGVACLTGILLGLVGRGVAAVLIAFLAIPNEPQAVVKAENTMKKEESSTDEEHES
ncbi:hypothetical protein D9611_000651 [Ephemerocybe angulata]|uniref:Uncharacterized protein n=1 Tax=Ephemerocybe angulata TaxID=980116 RepID=A0A8H5F764_9AGAR|nr:hypothetical protein D9611_000651 [Tulosesus angulatus]